MTFKKGLLKKQVEIEGLGKAKEEKLVSVPAIKERQNFYQ